ncbi:MAG: hypothetical protein HC895_21930 [Leptolyngbyaceae cyanobacterium SM1_3_5]|nr:hypothetical protein [Leptolyngbyaceae cyanobacterium SM1_3_5]
MLKTVEGIYQDGKVELAEQPQTTGDRVQVLVTFLDASTVDPAKLRQLIDQLETIAGLQQGFEELNAGQTRSIVQFSEEFLKQCNTPLYSYDVEDFELDLKNLRELGRL